MVESVVVGLLSSALMLSPSVVGASMSGAAVESTEGDTAPPEASDIVCREGGPPVAGADPAAAHSAYLDGSDSLEEGDLAGAWLSLCRAYQRSGDDLATKTEILLLLTKCALSLPSDDVQVWRLEQTARALDVSLALVGEGADESADLRRARDEVEARVSSLRPSGPTQGAGSSSDLLRTTTRVSSLRPSGSTASGLLTMARIPAVSTSLGGAAVEQSVEGDDDVMSGDAEVSVEDAEAGVDERASARIPMNVEQKAGIGLLTVGLSVVGAGVPFFFVREQVDPMIGWEFESYVPTGVIFVAIGAAASVVGVAFLLSYGSRKRKSRDQGTSARLAPFVGSTGAGFTVAGRF
jgi:hypothetical protein